MKRLISALAIFFLMSSAAAALSDLPQYDVDQYCRKLAVATSMLNGHTVATCANRERAAYDGLRGEWDRHSKGAKDYCVTLVNKINPSYVLLTTCLKQTQRSAGRVGQ